MMGLFVILVIVDYLLIGATSQVVSDEVSIACFTTLMVSTTYGLIIYEGKLRKRFYLRLAARKAMAKAATQEVDNGR